MTFDQAVVVAKMAMKAARPITINSGSVEEDATEFVVTIGNSAPTAEFVVALDALPRLATRRV